MTDFEESVNRLVVAARRAALAEAEAIVLARAAKMGSYQLGEIRALRNAAKAIQALREAEVPA